MSLQGPTVALLLLRASSPEGKRLGPVPVVLIRMDASRPHSQKGRKADQEPAKVSFIHSFQMIGSLGQAAAKGRQGAVSGRILGIRRRSRLCQINTPLSKIMLMKLCR